MDFCLWILNGKSVPVEGYKTVRKGSLLAWFPHETWDYLDGANLLGFNILEAMVFVHG